MPLSRGIGLGRKCCRNPGRAAGSKGGRDLSVTISRNVEGSLTADLCQVLDDLHLADRVQVREE